MCFESEFNSFIQDIGLERGVMMDRGHSTMMSGFNRAVYCFPYYFFYLTSMLPGGDLMNVDDAIQIRRLGKRKEYLYTTG
jgi:hypothetical protein